MNRTILFRGKRLDNGQWIEGNLLLPAHGETEGVAYIKEGLSGHRIAVDPDTVSERTGLTDMQGNPVFEGDILKLTHEWSDGQIDVWFAQVEFGNPNGRYHWGWQLRKIYGDYDFNPDILLWLGGELDEQGITNEVFSCSPSKQEIKRMRRAFRKAIVECKRRNEEREVQ